MNGHTVPSLEAFEALERRVAELERLLADACSSAASPWMTVVEAAEYMRCRRQRVDDLLSKGRLTRHKDGARTLVARAEIDTYLAGESPNRRERPPSPEPRALRHRQRPRQGGA